MRDTSDCTNCNGSEERSHLRAALQKAEAERDEVKARSGRACEEIFRMRDAERARAERAERERDDAQHLVATVSPAGHKIDYHAWESAMEQIGKLRIERDSERARADRLEVRLKELTGGGEK